LPIYEHDPQEAIMSGRFRALKVLSLAVFAFALVLSWREANPAPQTPQEYSLSLPSDVIPPLIPDDNPLTAAKVALGQKLYFDARLSTDNTVSCATCHDPAQGFGDGKVVAAGIGKKTGSRNSPTVLNAAFNDFQFWDGRAPTLEEQAKGPLINPVEMGMASHDALVGKLQNIAEYPPLFKQAFDSDQITIDNVARAIASYERTVFSFSSPFDRFNAGDKTAMSASAQRGWDLFNNKARCNNCHGYVASAPTFTDNKFHNIGVAMHATNFAELARKVGQSPESTSELAHAAGYSELGRFLVTKEPKDIGAFKTPGLRNVALTAPYMHDGSQKTLEEVIKFYDKGGEDNPYLDGGIRPLKLTAQEETDLVEFLKALTSDDLTRFSKPNSQP
jgi:cytochrome c peroxidase